MKFRIETGALRSYTLQFQTTINSEWAQVRTEVRNGFQMRVHTTTLKTTFLNNHTIQILKTFYYKLQQLNSMDDLNPKVKSHSSEHFRGPPSLLSDGHGGFSVGIWLSHEADSSAAPSTKVWAIFSSSKTTYECKILWNCQESVHNNVQHLLKLA